MTPLLLAILMALLLLVTALFSVQNVALVSLRWLVWQSVPLPLGLVLTLGFALGLVSSALVQGGQRLSRR